jgi:ABC-type maltose transport system permease subunit
MAKAGSSDLAKQEQRLAYWLLAPTFLILLAIAIYPLFSVFYNSFTNNVFASSAPTEFVGLRNYQQLLSMTIQVVPPRLDESGQPVTDPETGATVYESAVSVLPRDPVRYRQVTQFNLFGTQFVLGATDPDFIRAVWDTIVFAVATVFLELVLGMIVALIVNANFKGRGFMRAIILMPVGDPHGGVVADVGIHVAAEPHRLLQHCLLVSGPRQRRDSLPLRSRLAVAVDDHDRRLEDDALHGAVDVGRSAVDSCGHL